MTCSRFQDERCPGYDLLLEKNVRVPIIKPIQDILYECFVYFSFSAIYAARVPYVNNLAARFVEPFLPHARFVLFFCF